MGEIPQFQCRIALGEVALEMIVIVEEIALTLFKIEAEVFPLGVVIGIENMRQIQSVLGRELGIGKKVTQVKKASDTLKINLKFPYLIIWHAIYKLMRHVDVTKFN